jgi:hypothetical protein
MLSALTSKKKKKNPVRNGFKKKLISSRAPVGHAYNPSYFETEIGWFKTSPGK